MIRKLIHLSGALLLPILLLSGCETKPVVGVLMPRTGLASDYGDSIESGINLAVSQARELDQLPSGFEVVAEDTASDPSKAVSTLRQLVREKKAKMIIGGVTSAEAKAMLPVLEELNIVCLSPSASTPSLTKESKLFYRIFPSDELEGNTAGKFLRDRMKKETVLLYTSDSEYARGFEPEFRNQFEVNLKGKIVGKIDISSPSWQEDSAALLRSAHPDAVYIIAYADPILSVLRHLNEQHYDGALMTTSAFYSNTTIKKAGKLAEGLLFPLPPFDRTSEVEPVVSFVQRYMDTYQRAPDTFAAHGYDAMRLAIQVMNTVRTPVTSEIGNALHFGVSEFVGVTGPILFDDFGDVKHYPKMFIIKDGQVLGYQRYVKAERERIFGQVMEMLDKNNP